MNTTFLKDSILDASSKDKLWKEFTSQKIPPDDKLQISHRFIPVCYVHKSVAENSFGIAFNPDFSGNGDYEESSLPRFIHDTKMLDYVIKLMYHSEVNVLKDDLRNFLDICHRLKIRFRTDEGIKYRKRLRNGETLEYQRVYTASKDSQPNLPDAPGGFGSITSGTASSDTPCSDDKNEGDLDFGGEMTLPFLKHEPSA